jgi:glycine hydroxymethyltransferase
LYGCNYANVQPHSGAQANGAVFLALIKPNDTILGMSLDAGGHLTHGAKPSQSGKWFNPIQYGVNENGLIDYDQVEALAKEHKPKLIIAGGSAYSRKIDFKKFREVADLVGAYLLVDMAHYSGLVAAGEYPNPIEYADVVTSTTHKTIRGPRGGMILSNNLDLGKKFNSAVFPGLQGGPLMHVIAAKAVAFGEALKPEFKTYIQQVISNAKILGETLVGHGLNLASGGTDTHLLLVDLTPKGLTGDIAEASLERANITCNKNSIPFDPKPPKVTSGIRIGTPAATTRGFNNEDFIKVGDLIVETLEGLQNNPDDNSKVEENVRTQVKELCDKYPIYN